MAKSNAETQVVLTVSDAQTAPPIVLPTKKGDLETPKSKSLLPKCHPSLVKVLVALTFYLIVGFVCFYIFKDQIKGKKTNRGVDSIYLIISTMTASGYGDLVPNGVAIKLLVCALVFGGMALIGLVVSKAADYLVEKQEVLLVKALHFSEEVSEAELLKEIKTNRAKYKLLVTSVGLLILMIIGTLFLYKVEGLDFVNSFYAVVCLMTTLGYGDKTFNTVGGRVFAIFWILSGTICVAQFFLYIAELNSEKRRQSLVQLVLKRRMTGTDLAKADLDNDKLVSANEFIIYKLKEMEKISEEDIALLMEEFQHQDVDQSKTLSPSDIKSSDKTLPIS
ncbi:hypothetical protein ACHQM5_007836 [Ranunculus cassubicifolius]